MKFNYLVVGLLVCSIAAQAQGQRTLVSKAAVKKVIANHATDETQTLPIKRVILYSNGVAYIERRGMVSGHAEINLTKFNCDMTFGVDNKPFDEENIPDEPLPDKELSLIYYINFCTTRLQISEYK